MNYQDALANIQDNKLIDRESWNGCKIVRKAQESDREAINYPIENIIVEDCEDRVCDCQTAIYQPTSEDLNATDWQVIEE